MLASARRVFVVLACLVSMAGLSLAGSQSAIAQDAEVRYAGIVMDANSGEVLFERYADSARFPASITKVMTLYLVFEALAEGRINANDYITISPRAASQPPSKLGLPVGSRITVDNAIRALAVRSCNDIAVALAEYVGGSEAAFAESMTRRARQLGMRQTNYVNPHGLPDSRQLSSARDIAILSRAVMRDFPQYYHYFGQRHWEYEGRNYNNTNGLLHSMPGVDGIKTGFTNASGYNLAASAVRDGRRLITVVLGGRTTATRNAHVADLLNIGFDVERRVARGESLAQAQVMFASLPGGVGAHYATGRGYTAPLQYASVEVPVSAEVLAASAQLDAVADAEEAEEAASAAVLASATPTARPTAPVRAQGDGATGWIVQVGAFREQNVAQEWLGEVGRRFRDQFRGVEGAITPSDNGWFRARYVGFTRTAADAACEALTARNVPCMVIRAQ
ncbi:MAG: D-alanyl-D-alanine carboxypeptidase [Caulobacterales bacterium]|nr:D-alanyl-D-alanine carboxypeptidase [Caulobacterales bacterium]